MRLGCCGRIEDAALLRDAGFDFLEVSAIDVLAPTLPSPQWEPTMPDVAKLPLPVEAARDTLPPDLHLLGPRRSMARLQDYVQRLAKRSEQLGITLVTIDAPLSRRRPDDVDTHLANEQIAEFLRMAGQVSAHHGVTVALQPMTHRVTNTVNRLEQARAIVDRVARRNVAVCLSVPDFAAEGEGEDIILQSADRLAHVHLPDPTAPPVGHERPFDLDHLFCLLQKIGYAGRVSVCPSAATVAPDAARQTVHTLRQAWSQADRCEESL